jgi:hypothetical protein
MEGHHNCAVGDEDEKDRRNRRNREEEKSRSQRIWVVGSSFCAGVSRAEENLIRKMKTRRKIGSKVGQTSGRGIPHEIDRNETASEVLVELS